MAIRELNKLTPRQVAAIKDDGWHSDGGGLYLRVSDDGRRRRWIYRYIRTIDGKRKVTEIGLGAADSVTLARAREERRRLADEVNAGRNPIQERQRAQREQANRKTFGEVARLVIDKNSKGWSLSSLTTWERSLYVHCAKIAKVYVEDVATADVMDIVTPLIDTGYYSTARRTLSRIADVLGYAIAHEWRSRGNVAAWENIKSVIPKRPKNGDESDDRHHPMLPWQEAPAAIAALRESESMSARCLEFIALTAVRLTEGRAARWPEFDFATATWTIPATRMKRSVMFKVPLCDRALAILDELRMHRTGPVVFFGQGRGPVTRHVCWMQCRRVTEDRGSPHGWRATFRSWCADNGVDDGVAEACLSHGPGDATKATYNRAEMVARRRDVMQDWAAFLSGEAANAKAVSIASGSKSNAWYPTGDVSKGGELSLSATEDRMRRPSGVGGGHDIDTAQMDGVPQRLEDGDYYDARARPLRDAR
jgi:integrase